LCDGCLCTILYKIRIHTNMSTSMNTYISPPCDVHCLLIFVYLCFLLISNFHLQIFFYLVFVVTWFFFFNFFFFLIFFFFFYVSTQFVPIRSKSRFTNQGIELALNYKQHILYIIKHTETTPKQNNKQQQIQHIYTTKSNTKQKTKKKITIKNKTIL
jgi:hypothetical protein